MKNEKWKMIRSTQCPLERPQPMDCEGTSSPPTRRCLPAGAATLFLFSDWIITQRCCCRFVRSKETRWRPPGHQEWEQKKTEAHLTAPFPKVGFTQTFKPTCDIIGTETASFASSPDARMSCEDLSITKENGSPNLSFQVFCSFWGGIMEPGSFLHSLFQFRSHARVNAPSRRSKLTSDWGPVQSSSCSFLLNWIGLRANVLFTVAGQESAFSHWCRVPFHTTFYHNF